MSKHNHRHEQESQTHDVSVLAQDAQELITATAGMAGEKVVEARKRLSDSLASIRESIAESARSADKAVRENPYKAIGVAAGIGLLVGALLARRSDRNDNAY